MKYKLLTIYILLTSILSAQDKPAYRIFSGEGTEAQWRKGIYSANLFISP
jgi:hypothetical protein